MLARAKRTVAIPSLCPETHHFTVAFLCSFPFPCPASSPPNVFSFPDILCIMVSWIGVWAGCLPSSPPSPFARFLPSHLLVVFHFLYMFCPFVSMWFSLGRWGSQPVLPTPDRVPRRLNTIYICTTPKLPKCGRRCGCRRDLLRLCPLHLSLRFHLAFPSPLACIFNEG